MKFTVTMEILLSILVIFSVLELTKGQLTTKPADRQQLCSDDASQCYGPDSRQICSGRGECICGLCQCSSRRGDLPLKYTGKWCQCDDSSCPTFNGALCGGSDHGVCDCGFCKCYKNFIGRNCGCSTKTDMCKADDGSLCGGHGKCLCNKCQCDIGYAGERCTECKNCNTCDTMKHCVECVVYNTGKYKDKCSTKCSNLKINVVDDVKLNVSNSADAEQPQFCEYEGIQFTVLKQSRNGLQITASRIQEGPENSGNKKTSALWISFVLVTLSLLLC